MDCCFGIVVVAGSGAALGLIWVQVQVMRVSRVRTAYRRGDTTEALRRLTAMGPPRPNRPMWMVEYLNLYNASGQYRRAVAEVSLLFPKLRAGPVTDPMRGLVLVNLSEALGELGLSSEALEVVDRVLPRDPKSFTHAGAQLQKAWVLQSMGKPEHALRIIAEVNPEVLRPDYTSEFFFVRCAALTKLKRFDEAEAALAQARQNLTRASAERNALFLEAALREAQGQVEAALECYARGAEHAYRGQGGRALVAWGQLLLRTGRPVEARRAFQWALERDPECESAVEARRALAMPP